MAGACGVGGAAAPSYLESICQKSGIPIAMNVIDISVYDERIQTP